MKTDRQTKPHSQVAVQSQRLAVIGVTTSKPKNTKDCP